MQEQEMMGSVWDALILSVCGQKSGRDIQSAAGLYWSKAQEMVLGWTQSQRFGIDPPGIHEAPKFLLQTVNSSLIRLPVTILANTFKLKGI